MPLLFESSSTVKHQAVDCYSFPSLSWLSWVSPFLWLIIQGFCWQSSVLHYVHIIPFFFAFISFLFIAAAFNYFLIFYLSALVRPSTAFKSIISIVLMLSSSLLVSTLVSAPHKDVSIAKTLYRMLCRPVYLNQRHLYVRPANRS